MLTIIRKNLKPVMLVLTVIICVAFGWFYVRYDTRSGSQRMHYGSIYGEEVGEHNIREMKNHWRTAAELSLPGMNLLAARGANSERIMPYLGAVLIVRHEAEKLGLHAGEQEIEERVRTLEPFLTNGQFDSNKFRLYAGTGSDDGLVYTKRSPYGGPPQIIGPIKLSRRGMDVQDLYKVIGDYILLEKLQEVVGAGILGNPEMSDRRYALSGQKIDFVKVPFPATDYKDKVKITDEEITQYYEENVEKSFTIPERKVVEYTIIAPKLPEKPKADEKKDEKTATVDEKKDTPEEPVLESPEDSKKRTALADTLYNALIEGEDFARLASDNALELKTTEPVTLMDLPEDLKGKHKVQALINRLSEEAPIAPPVKDDDTWYMARLKKLLPPEPKPIADVREEIVTALTAQKSLEAAMDDAKEKLAKLTETVGKDGKLMDAATAMQLKPVEVKDYDMTAARQDPDARALLPKIQLAAPGTLLDEPIQGTETVYIVQVVDRSIEKNPNKAARLEMGHAYAQNQRRQEVFFEWWQTRFKDAEFIENNAPKEPAR